MKRLLRPLSTLNRGLGLGLGLASLAVLLTACGSAPAVPEWQMNAHGALQRYEQAFLSGSDRAAQAEFSRARTALASTGQAERVAYAELTRCALQVASLVFEPCSGFEGVRADTSSALQAYGDYLQARITAGQIPWLPVAHRAAAAQPTAAALQAIADPLARVVAAGVALRAGRADAAVMAVAAETASQQGWRRPLAAWLAAGALAAEQAGQPEQAALLRRRLALVLDQPPSTAP